MWGNMGVLLWSISGRFFNILFFAFWGHDSKPLFGFGFGRESFVMLVDHGRRVPCLLSGQILVGMERKMVGAKGVAKTVAPN